jgi:hypothetical protein
MQTNTRELILKQSPEKVYRFIKNPGNYLSGISGVHVSNNSATFSVPGFGNIEASITNLVENEKVVIYSSNINTSLEARLFSREDGGTKIQITSKSDPDCGFFKNKLILFSIPSLLDSLIDNLKYQNI